MTLRPELDDIIDQPTRYLNEQRPMKYFERRGLFLSILQKIKFPFC